jgi:hypothetical protein
MHEALGSFAVMWGAMCVVMMAPTATRPMLRIANGRVAKGAVFLAAYLVVWLVLALPAYPIAGRVWSGFALFAGWILVGAYQLLPSTSGLMRSCRTLRVGGPAWISGLRYGLACAAACAPLMIVAMATLHAFNVPLVVAALAMAAVTGFIMWEKAPRVPLMAVRLSGTAMIVAAALAFTLIAPSAHDLGHDAQVAGSSRS